MARIGTDVRLNGGVERLDQDEAAGRAVVGDAPLADLVLELAGDAPLANLVLELAAGEILRRRTLK